MQVNLIPRERMARRRRLTRRRIWISLNAVYALFLLVATIAARVSGVSDDRVLRTTYVQISEDAERSRAAVDAMRTQLHQMGAVLRANRTIGERPDWSVLLALLAHMRGEEIILRDASLGAPAEGRRVPVAAPGGADEGAPLVLTLGGVGRTQQDVAAFVVRLEETGLFRRVTLLDTHREPLLDGHVVAFRLECVFETRPLEASS